MKYIIKYGRNSRIVDYDSEDRLEEAKRKFAEDMALIRGRNRHYATSVILPALIVEKFTPTYRMYLGHNADLSDRIVNKSFEDL